MIFPERGKVSRKYRSREEDLRSREFIKRNFFASPFNALARYTPSFSPDQFSLPSHSSHLTLSPSNRLFHKSIRLMHGNRLLIEREIRLGKGDRDFDLSESFSGEQGGYP